MKELNIIIPYNYTPRKHQDAFWKAMNAGYKRAILVWHRRAGKDKTCWNYLIKEAFKRVGTYYYIFPDSKMAKRILWDGIDSAGFKVLDHIPEKLVKSVNNTEMKVVLKNGSVILVLGSHDVDSLRGPNPVGTVFSEYSEQSPHAWEVVSPILRENGGWSIFNGTPKGQNHFRDTFEMAKRNPEWFAQLLNIDATYRPDGSPIISEDDINAERASGMSEDMIKQEYYCSFTEGIEGSYYAKYIQQLRDESRIGRVPWDKQQRVHTSWDLGYGDSTAIIFYQYCGQEIHVIDCYESCGEGLPHYAGVLADKPYIYGDHYAPHDIESHQFSTGLSAKEVGANLGLRFITLPTSKLRLEDGIEALRGLFPRLWIDATKCDRLIKCLENYRKEYDEKHSCYRDRPVHDWTSHFADSARYMAISVKKHYDLARSGVDEETADRLWRKNNPRFD